MLGVCIPQNATFKYELYSETSKGTYQDTAATRQVWCLVVDNMLNDLQFKYDDGEAEDLNLADERVKFSISSQEMKWLNRKFGIFNLDNKGHDELLALVVSFHDYPRSWSGWSVLHPAGSVCYFSMDLVFTNLFRPSAVVNNSYCSFPFLAAKQH